MNQILQMGAQLIKGNSDDATSGLDVADIAAALQRVLGGSQGFDISSIVSAFSSGGFSDLVSSWISSGSNAPLSADVVEKVLGGDKVSEFASQLGIGQDSAKQALADALPAMVDKVTDQNGSLAEDLMKNMGGIGSVMKSFGF
ncbi:MAG: YidB family protein [Hydrogenimonas sp.]|nr:YidB family protein [Hydrogenimonas sp.]